MCSIAELFLHFNPRPREEGDITRVNSLLRKTYFNPRPREEGDGNTAGNGKTNTYFNPRPREEGDSLTENQTLPDPISIHALVKRATANLYNDYLYFEAKYHISDIFHQ